MARNVHALNVVTISYRYRSNLKRLQGQVVNARKVIVLRIIVNVIMGGENVQRSVGVWSVRIWYNIAIAIAIVIAIVLVVIAIVIAIAKARLKNKKDMY